MRSRTNSKEANDLSGITVEMIREMVRRAEAKLSSLQSRKTNIRRRIQALHHLSKALAAAMAFPRIEDQVPQADLPAEKQKLPNAADEGPVVNAREVTSRGSESAALRRACRIALMESDEAQCSAQILQRIARRESVLFGDHTDRLQAVSTELDQLVKDCEAITFGAGNTQRWQLNRIEHQHTGLFDSETQPNV